MTMSYVVFTGYHFAMQQMDAVTHEEAEQIFYQGVLYTREECQGM